MPKKPEPIEYNEKCKQLKTLLLSFLSGCIDLRFGDETAFNLQPNVPYGWIRKGEQRGIPSRKGGNLNVFGLMNFLGELTTYQTTANVNSQTVIDWLDNFASTIKAVTVVVLDNAPWHTSKVIEGKIRAWEEQGLIIFYLPPYSPHLNPIEILWRKIKLEWLKPEDYNSKEDLHQAVNNIFEKYDTQPFKINFDLSKRY